MIIGATFTETKQYKNPIAIPNKIAKNIKKNKIKNFFFSLANQKISIIICLR